MRVLSTGEGFALLFSDSKEIKSVAKNLLEMTKDKLVYFCGTEHAPMYRLKQRCHDARLCADVMEKESSKPGVDSKYAKKYGRGS